MTRLLPTLASLKQHKSALVLIVANLYPLGGVLFLNWTAFDIVFLFWLENVIIGGFNLLKILLCSPAAATPGSPDARPVTGPARGLLVVWMLGKLFLAGFFTFHYGMFCFVHGVFVVVLLGRKETASGMLAGDFPGIVAEMIAGDLFIPFLALLLSHGFSFVWNYVRQKEYARVTPGELMQAPYGRVVAIHCAILLGAFLTFLFQGYAVLLVLLVAKIVLDLKFHLKERETGAVSLFRAR